MSERADDHKGSATNTGGAGFSVFWFLYGQIAAVLAAISLLVFLQHFVDVGLKGVVRETVDWWIANVRPLVGLPIQYLIDQLPEKLRFVLSDPMKDYFGVGVVVFLSEMRAWKVLTGENLISFDGHSFVLFVITLIVAIGIVIMIVVGWPWRFFELFPSETPTNQSDVGNNKGNGIFGPPRPRSFQWKRFSLTFLPVLYFALILAANAWLM